MRKASPETELRRLKPKMKRLLALCERQTIMLDKQNAKFQLAIKMWHVCFGIAQGAEITPRLREVCAELQKEWDKS